MASSMGAGSTRTASATVTLSVCPWYRTSSVTLNVPGAVRLMGAVPNPFNPMTEIRFHVPAAMPVSLSVYDVAGRLVRTLVNNEIQPAGEQEIFWQDAAGDVFVVSFTPSDGDGPSFSVPRRLFEERLFSRDGGRILDYSIAREQFLVARPAGPKPRARIVFVSDWRAALSNGSE